MRFIIPVLAVLAFAGCNQKAVEDLAACNTEMETVKKSVDQLKTDLATANTAKMAAEQRATTAETQVKDMLAAAEAAVGKAGDKAAAGKSGASLKEAVKKEAEKIIEKKAETAKKRGNF